MQLFKFIFFSFLVVQGNFSPIFGKEAGDTTLTQNKNQGNICPGKCLLDPDSVECESIQENSSFVKISTVFSICNKYFNTTRFPSSEECEKKCNNCRVKQMLAKCKIEKYKPSGTPQDFAICQLKPQTGLCRGYFRMFYYNPRKRRCESFVYGGCGGNANRFSTELACLIRCGMMAYSKANKHTEL